MSETRTSEEDRKIMQAAGSTATNRGGGRWGAIGMPAEQSGDFTATLKRLGLVPRRTIRVVLFTNEENGLRGGKAYALDHAAELPRTVLAVEADSGGFAPTGFGVDHADDEAAKRMQVRIGEIASLLRELGATKVELGGGGADISRMKQAGVPQVGLAVDNRSYFDYHHTEADTLDKVDPADLAGGVAAAAVLAYVIADMPGRVDAP